MVSLDFQEAALQAWRMAQNNPDPAVRYAVQNVPIYTLAAPSRRQAIDGGCPNCTYLGLWADQPGPDYPVPPGGYPASNHGYIWLFEEGIRNCSDAELDSQTHAVLIHEIDHALQRDHILDAMRTAAYAWARPSP